MVDGLLAVVLTLSAAFFLGFTAASLVAAIDFELRFLVQNLTGGGHFRLLGHIRYRVRRGIRISCWSYGGLDNTPPDDPITPLAQVHLLGRETDPFSFRGV